MKIPSLPKPSAGQKRNIHPSKILRSIIDVVAAIDLNGIIVYISPSAIDLYGYTAEELTGHSFADHILQEDLEYCYASIQQGLQGMQGSNWESRLVHKNGSIIPVICSGRWDEEDQLFYCVFRNGSEKRALEDRLNKARQQARIAHFEFDFSGKQQHYFSENFFDILGILKENEKDFDFDSLQKMVHPDDRGIVPEQEWFRQREGDHSIDYRIQRPDGNISFINRVVTHQTDEKGRLLRLVGTVQDITDRKLTELALQQSEARFRALIEYGNSITGIVNAEGHYTYLSDNVEKQLGYRREEMLGRSGFDYIHPEDIAAMVSTLESAVNKEVCESPPFRFRNSKGEWRWMELTLVNLLSNSAVNGLIVQSRDITEKKQKDEALELSEKKFKSLVQNSADLVAIIDEKGSFTYISDNVNYLLGYEPEDIIGRNAFDFLADEDKEKVAVEIMRVLTGLSEGKGIQHRFRHKNGKMIWFESKGTNLYRHNSIKGIMVNTRNIDDRVRLQEKLNLEEVNKQKEITAAVIKAQEMERSQLGLELHDNVNQVLTTVKLYNEMYLTGYVQ
ncbi:MAG: PAS domain S-box protein, partial [Flavitalea sp.]